jgi:hypothetical protein
MQPSTYAAGVRRRFEDLPPTVIAWVEGELGGSIRSVRNASGGFSPGVAAVVASAEGAELFVKAVGSGVNADALRFYRAERDVALRMPSVSGVLAPTGGTDLEVADESYVVITFPALHGETPRHPWHHRELTVVLDALVEVSARLTPSPWPAEPGDQRLLGFFTWWARIGADGDDPWRSDSRVASSLVRFVALEEQLRGELPGTTLSHTDLRADNIVMTPAGVWFVDWAHAQNAAPWLDAGLLLADVIGSRADLADGGDVDVGAVIRRHPSTRSAGFEAVWRLVLGLAGAMHGMSRQPSPPGLPTIRAWQATTAETLLSWCHRESPDDQQPG